ncbi:hypothetical protein [Anaerolinea thermophila]|uniref:Uncharacterized protein n=1 Tax=Anaerolinea thermophila (strain DSM 14523 / JCM 11388 / NBRC 100420 / UNI-1) TaxID=926569 RepID=E8N240_ANATU|nr:hypothetical protein [Anaerolinea thermophila]BAJ64987.1 hypothetical protein ANT_29610 [Anaerolinea thermophila UNI-1]
MKRPRWIVGAWLLVNLIGLAALGLGWMALNDIFHDYVSPQVLAEVGIEASPPEWTQTSGEWSMVLITWAFLLALMALNVLIAGWFFLRRPYS